MQIETIKVGYLQTNCYILQKENQCLIIDPGDESDKIQSKINTTPKAIILTHHHFDHIGAVNTLQNIYNIPIYDNTNMKEQTYIIGPFIFDTIFTKGHSDDSVTYYFKQENIMFTGDFLFKQTVGRTDLETGNEKEMLQSIEKIKHYPDSIQIFPGHGEETTLQNEKQNNPYF